MCSIEKTFQRSSIKKAIRGASIKKIIQGFSLKKIFYKGELWKEGPCRVFHYENLYSGDLADFPKVLEATNCETNFGSSIERSLAYPIIPLFDLILIVASISSQ